jgi:ArsR family transcriptional regulator, virulence genes transcriptional regulator
LKSRRRIEQVASTGALLANPLRVEILERLRRGPCIVGDLVEAVGEGQATVSKQLAVLREAGLLACRPDGRCREYALADPDRVGAVLESLQALGTVAAVQAATCQQRRAGRREQA